MLMVKIAVPFPSLVTLVVLVAMISLSDGGVEILIMIVMITLIKVRFSSVHSKALILLISSTPSSIFQKKKTNLVLLFLSHSPHLELVGAVTVETLELLLPPKVCLSAP